MFEITGLQAEVRARWIHALTATGRFVVDSFFNSLKSDLTSKATHAFTNWSHDGPSSPSSSIPIADVNQDGCGVLDEVGGGGAGVKVGVAAGEARSACTVVAEEEVPPEARVRVGRLVVADVLAFFVDLSLTVLVLLPLSAWSSVGASFRFWVCIVTAVGPADFSMVVCVETEGLAGGDRRREGDGAR